MKGHELVLRDVYAHALGGDAVVAQGHDGAAGAAAHEVEHDDERYHYENEARGEARDGVRARRALGALDYLYAALREAEVGDGLRAVQVEYHVQAVLVAADDEAVYELFDYLAEGQGDDGEIVAAQAEHGDADNDTRYGGAGRAGDEGYGEPHGLGGDGGLEAHRRHDAGEGADAHEARVAEAQLAEDADGEVQRDGHDDVAAYGHELAAEGAREHIAVQHRVH